MGEALKPQSVVVRKSDLPNTPVDGDLVILNMATNNYVGLDEIGRRIWDALEEPRRVDELCRLMTEHYAGAPEEIGRDVVAFLNELSSEGLIRVSEG